MSIGKLHGIVDYIDLDHLVLNVNSVGYIIHCSISFLSKIKNNDKLELFIDTQTREDGVYLYGFEKLEIKKQFSILITVKGVGPKLALAILSDMSIEDISRAIITQDKSRFQSVAGVGLKLAERIIVELKGKTAQLNLVENQNNFTEKSICNDAVSALINLGISRADAYSKVTKILEDHPDIKIDKLISMSLR